METYLMGEYDIAVIGAGHAGCEAALACARLGSRTIMFSINLESIAMMPCNPSIGGTGKGQLVREIDALGGEMGVNIDKTFIQSRMLNTAKGPAVHSLRAQADKQAYHAEMKKTIEREPLLDMKQDEIVDLVVEAGRVAGVMTKTHAIYRARAVIIATGTFLGGRVFIGDSSFASGPNGLAPSVFLTDSLKKYGLGLRRFKTGTPARAMASSFDYDKMTVQRGDEKIVPFSFMSGDLEREQVPCWLTYTNEETHKVIRANFDRSALFGGQIEGVGPRYCPSIEDKIRRFPDRKRHQLFIEPEGLDTEEMYIQGMSSSMPEDVQRDFYHTISGLEHIRITRPAYAIEYDCIDPLQLKPSLECRILPGLFCAGQFNGSSGYEEAAAQGLMAGINAHLAINGKDPFVLSRSEAYIGVLIDDLVTKGTNEPYRMMTSRAEFRLLLRQDNADERLTEKGHQIGLVTEERYRRFLRKHEQVQAELSRLEKTYVMPERLASLMVNNGKAPPRNRESLAELLRRPELSYEALAPFDPGRPELPEHVTAEVSVQIKYAGYIEKQLAQVARMSRLEERRLPRGTAYSSISGLRTEAAQKLDLIKPETVGRASRISGVSPADISVLLVWLEREKRRNG